MSKEAAYYRERAQAERDAAEASLDPTIRAIHLEMAEAYTRLSELRLEHIDHLDSTGGAPEIDPLGQQL